MGETGQYTFSKSERLTNIKLIESVFANNQSVKSFPLIFIYQSVETEQPYQVLFSVSKKKFKRAVDRNRIKRLMRETFRLNKKDFVDALANLKVIGAFIYTAGNICDYSKMNAAQQKINQQLKDHLLRSKSDN